MRDELFDAARRERAVRVGRVGVIEAPKGFIIGAVDGPAIGIDELMQFVPGQHQCQFGLIHHATITRSLAPLPWVVSQQSIIGLRVFKRRKFTKGRRH